MSVFRLNQGYIKRELDKVPSALGPARRLQLDLAALFTGPTCGNEASKLAEKLVSFSDDEHNADIARAMIEAGERYLRGQ